MSIFDKLKKNAQTAVKSAAASAFASEETFTFAALPESLAEMKALPEASLASPFATAALTVCALCVFAADKQIGTEMLNFLRGPRPLSNHDISFLNDRFSDGHHVPFEATVNGGQMIRAEGSANFPKGYHKFVRALDAMLAEHEKTE